MIAIRYVEWERISYITTGMAEILRCTLSDHHSLEEFEEFEKMMRVEDEVMDSEEDIQVLPPEG